jgi:hypothetical protein
VNTNSENRLVVAWLVLSAITLSQLSVGSIEGETALDPNALVACGAIVIALLKVRIIFREFMEVRHAPARLGRLTDAWVVLTGVVLLGSYFIGTALARG